MKTSIHPAFKVSLIASTLATVSIAQAETTHRQHDAHVHGVVEFNIAQDGNEMLMEITAPGFDIVGFEHAPMNEQQHQAIESAEAVLQNAASVFTLTSAANCAVEYVSVTNTLEEDEHAGHDHEEHEHHDDHDHEEHEHHDDHDHEEHEHHDDHAGHDHGESESSHGAFTVEYHFDCQNLSALSDIETTWFKHFPDTEKVSVNLLTDTQQKALELNSKSTLIKL
jgi:hypothetical protein